MVFEILVEGEGIVIRKHCELDFFGVYVVKVKKLLHFLEAQLIHVNFDSIQDTSDKTQGYNRDTNFYESFIIDWDFFQENFLHFLDNVASARGLWLTLRGTDAEIEV